MRLPPLNATAASSHHPHYYAPYRLLDENVPGVDSAEDQKLLQRILADKINDYADIDELRLLLVTGAQADGVVTQGLTPLHYTSYKGYYSAAKLLLVRGAKVDAVDDVGYSPLHLCAEKGNYRLIKLLLEYSAKVCYVDPDQKGVPFPIRESVDEPLRMAIRRGHYECAKLLLENGADPNARYFDGPELCHVSPMDTKLLRLLLESGANPNVYSRDGLTPLMKACRHKEKGIKAIRILLDGGADINATATERKDFRTALHFAVLSGSKELILFLIENGASVNMPPDYEKPSPLALAVLKDNPELVALLLEKGADPNSINGCFGSALHIACCSSGYQPESEQQEQEIPVDIYGGSDGSDGSNGVRRSKQYSMVELLLRNGADPNHSERATNCIVKSPMVEFLRITHPHCLPDHSVLALLLGYGGRIRLRPPQLDPLGQLRNIIHLLVFDEEVGLHALSMAETLAEGESEWAVAMRMVQAVENASAKQRLIAYLNRARPLQELARLAVRRACVRGGVSDLSVPTLMRSYLMGEYS